MKIFNRPPDPAREIRAAINGLPTESPLIIAYAAAVGAIRGIVRPGPSGVAAGWTPERRLQEIGRWLDAVAEIDKELDR